MLTNKFNGEVRIMYARRLTKEEIMKSGITTVTKDGRVFRENTEIKPTVNASGYFVINLFELDENGNRIIIPYEKSAFGYVYKPRVVGLHRLMYAWHYGEVPEGMIVDHKNNIHTHIEDYYLSNLQLLTPGDNLAKERDNWHVSELKCNLNKPRSHYENKLEGYKLAYEQAKKDKDAKAAHRLRCNISQTRARLRYYDSHIGEYLKEKQTTKPSEHECHARAEKRRELQANVDSARKFYKEVLAAYGKDDPIVTKYYYEWKMAIAMLNGFKEETKRERATSKIS